MPRPRGQRKLSRWEVLGAWLRLWTPPRDVDVPPVPWRAVGIGAFLVLVLVVLAVAVGIPAVTEHNRTVDERERAAAKEQTRARLARLALVQGAHHASADAAATVPERRALVERLEALVLKDA